MLCHDWTSRCTLNMHMLAQFVSHTNPNERHGLRLRIVNATNAANFNRHMLRKTNTARTQSNNSVPTASAAAPAAPEGSISRQPLAQFTERLDACGMRGKSRPNDFCNFSGGHA